MRVLPGNEDNCAHRPYILHVLVHAQAVARVLVLVGTQKSIHALGDFLQDRCGCAGGYRDLHKRRSCQPSHHATPLPDEVIRVASS